MNKILVLVLALSLFSCASKRQSGFEASGEKVTLTPKELASLKSDYEKNWKKRDEVESLKKAIEALDKIAGSNEANQETYTKLTHAYYLLADAHEVDVEKKKSLWEKGAMYGEKSLGFNAEFAKLIKEGKKPQESLDTLTKNEVAAMYWTASNLGKWAKHSGIASQLKYKGYIRALIGRVEKLDRNFFYGAVDRYNGAFYAIAPGFAGGDMDKSIDAFDKSIKIAPFYLGTKVLLAEYYYTKKGDKDKFVKTLNEVIETKDDIFKDLTPENRIEKKKAQNLLTKIEELF